jgi:hypothetical protein
MISGTPYHSYSLWNQGLTLGLCTCITDDLPLDPHPQPKKYFCIRGYKRILKFLVERKMKLIVIIKNKQTEQGISLMLLSFLFIINRLNKDKHFKTMLRTHTAFIIAVF